MKMYSGPLADRKVILILGLSWVTLWLIPLYSMVLVLFAYLIVL